MSRASEESSDVVNAFDIENAGDAFDSGQNAFELFAIFYVERHFNARVQGLAAAFEGADIRVGVADHGGDIGEHSGTVFGENSQAHREGSLRRAGPIHINAALGFVKKIFDVGAALTVDGDAAPARDVADDIVAGNRVTAFRAIDHQVVVAAHNHGGVAQAEHAFNGRDQLRALILGRIHERLAAGFREHLASGPLAVSKISVEIFHAAAAILGSNALPVFVGYFFQAKAGLACFLINQSAADFGGLHALVKINPLADLAPRTGSVHETEPVTGRFVTLLRENFDHIAIRKAVAERNHRPIHFCPVALISDFGVDGVSKINRSGAAREDHHAPLGREGVNLFRVKIDAESGEEFARFLHFLDPLDQLAHPDDALVVRLGNFAAVFVFPMSGDPLLSDAMHFLGSNLNFKRLTGVDDGGMQRLVEVRARHGDVVLEASGKRRPDLMDHAESCVAIFHRVGDHADGEQVEDLIERALLFLNFQMERIDALDAGLNFRGNAALDHFRADGFLGFAQEFVKDFLLNGDSFLNVEERLRLEITEGEIFEFPANQAHAKAIRDGGVNVERFARDALLAFGIKELERAHIVKAVGEFDHDHAHIVDHGEQHLADVFRLTGLGSEQVEAADFCGTFHEARDIVAELIGNLRERDFRVFDDVMEKRGAERSDVEAHVREQVGDFDRM